MESALCRAPAAALSSGTAACPAELKLSSKKKRVGMSWSWGRRIRRPMHN